MTTQSTIEKGLKIINTIGFAGTYYTLWKVSEPYEVSVGMYSHYIQTDHTFIQNLSKDLGKAKAKIHVDFEINLELRGQSSFFTRGETIEEVPEHLFPYGQLYGTEILISDNIWQLERLTESVGSHKHSGHGKQAKARLIHLGYKMYKGQLCSPKVLSLKKQDEKEARQEAKRIKGHHLTDGDKVQLKLKEIASFGFDGCYGWTKVVTYIDEQNRVFKYMGSSAPNISEKKFTSVMTTISHGRYDGQEETKIKRTKILAA